MASEFYNVKDVMEILCIGESKAYKIIQQFNKELKAKGFYTVAGKVSRKYFEERMGLC